MVERSRTPLPSDPDYWERLALRIRADAAEPLAAYAQRAWYGVLSHRAPWWVAASAAAILSFWLVLPAREHSDGVHWIERSLAPNEVAGTLMGGPVPPSVEMLLKHFPPEQAP